MKTATENLENDHIYIIQLTEIMDRMAETDNPSAEDTAVVIDIIRNYADGIHHAKEENLLFPKLGEKGMSPHQGPVAVMLHEHVAGRNYVKGMTESLELYLKGDTSAAAVLRQNMTGYASLLQNHISKENNILFRMADNVLSPDEQKNLLGLFQEEENNPKDGRKPEFYISAISRLAGKYLKK
ncbi:MAG: hemerythrin domain-containing protein [Bacteroidales bacterium]